MVWKRSSCSHHHKAFLSELFQEINPIDAAYAVVERVNSKLRSQYLEITKRHGPENYPLILHHDQNLVAVCLSHDKFLNELLHNTIVTGANVQL